MASPAIFDTFRVVDVSNSKYVCFVRLQAHDVVVFGACDGINVWHKILDHDQVSSGDRRESVRRMLSGGNIEITSGENELDVTLSLPTDSGHTQLYKLNKLPPAVCQTELKALLFGLAEKTVNLSTRCEQSEKTIESLKRTAVNSAAAGCSVFDMTSDAKKKKMQAKTQPKQAGMSLINPGTKKRTKAKGVEFD